MKVEKDFILVTDSSDRETLIRKSAIVRITKYSDEMTAIFTQDGEHVITKVKIDDIVVEVSK